MLRVELHQASLVADAGMLALWGFETFNVLAISRKFAELEPDRVGELVGAWALVDTSWRYSQVLMRTTRFTGSCSHSPIPAAQAQSGVVRQPSPRP